MRALTPDCLSLPMVVLILQDANIPMGSYRHGSVLMTSCSDQELHTLHELMRKLGLVAGGSGKGDAPLLPGPGPSSSEIASGSMISGGIHAPIPQLEGSEEVAGGKGGAKAARGRLEGFMARAATTAALFGERMTPSSAWESLLDKGVSLASGGHPGNEAIPDADRAGDLDAGAPNYLDKNTTGTGDYVHPLSRLLLARRPPAYVLDPRAHKLSASGDDVPEDGGGGAATGAGAAGKGGSTLKKGAAKSSGRPPAGSGSIASTPIAASTPPPQPSESAARGAASDPGTDPAGVVSGAGGGLEEMQPVSNHPSTSDAAAGNDGGGDGIDQPGSARSGRTRSAINYSLLSGKKDKQQAPESAMVSDSFSFPAPIVPDAVVASATVLPPMKKKRGRPSAAASAAAAAHSLVSGLPPPPSETPSGTPVGISGGSSATGPPAIPGLASSMATTAFLLGRAAIAPSSLNQDDLAGFNPVVADVARCVATGPAEGNLDQQVEH